MKVIISMAGMGWRFVNAGYKDPKFLIKVDGITIIEHVINLFSGEDDFIFICNKEHLASTNIKEILLMLKPNCKILEVDYVKKGPVYGGVILVEEHIPDDEPIIYSYCDYRMYWDYDHFKKIVNYLGVDSASVCYKGFHPHLISDNLYAGVRVDDNMFALDVREKFSFTENKIDTWQQTGTFYFKKGSILKKYAREVFEAEEDINGEFYISQLFNYMIRDGLKSYVYPVDYYLQWGTPEDLREYEAWSKFFTNKISKDKHIIFDNYKLNLTPEEFMASYEYWKKCFSLLKFHPYKKV